MRRHLKLFLFTGFLFAQNGLPYISPGVQLGINSKGKIFTSAQITIGYVGPTPPIGVTIGKRWYHLNQEKKSYSYYDFQVWPKTSNQPKFGTPGEARNAKLGFWGYII